MVGAVDSEPAGAVGWVEVASLEPWGAGEQKS